MSIKKTIEAGNPDCSRKAPQHTVLITSRLLQIQ